MSAIRLSIRSIHNAHAQHGIKVASCSYSRPLSSSSGRYDADNDGDHPVRPAANDRPRETSDLDAIFAEIRPARDDLWSDAGSSTKAAEHGAESVSKGGVSRDMGNEAESSRSVLARLGSTGRSSSRQPTSDSQERQSIRNVPLAGFAQPLPYTPSPRPNKGVHSRFKRLQGNTPFESTQFNQVISEIFADLNVKAFPFLDRDLGTDPFGARSPSVYGLSPRGRIDGRKRFLEREEEEDEEFVLELDKFKEELTTISTDHDLLDFARRKVFVPTPASGQESISSSSAPAPITFPRTYPHMLAHLIKVTRVNYNNPHLALAFFQYAQTHSVESYISGCLSAAYNELMRTRWECFRDLDGLDAAVREMDANGVGWDHNTQKLVGKVVEEIGTEVLELGVGRWGQGVYDVLGRLEKKVQKDIRDQEFIAEYKMDQKRKAKAGGFGALMDPKPERSIGEDNVVPETTA